MELDMNVPINRGFSAGVYMSATKELIEKLQNAIDEAKKELDKYFDVSDLMKQMPPPPVKHGVKEANDDVDGEEEITLSEEQMAMYAEVQRLILDMDTKHRQQVTKNHQMTKITHHLLESFGRGYANGELLSITIRYVARVNKAVEIYAVQTAPTPPPPSTTNQTNH
ncbi:hypothetical protein ABFS82_12G133400 [Erythranthe guttata]|uniref:uncharacterized protein LOC105968056 n=1 Tax=Erythranthe guttata TaxID=4155 RepID=UPI00064DF81F|nr:PREDICTED: uncharacterized protein LOC105968056 [Erythranthe guttata]|eukprot:XP_012848116.1 PREDICTED: uncharacterized protein LOC105968056 [Erythranthe guttata]